MENTLHDPTRDWMLSTLNTIVNNNNITIGITVVVSGIIVSGHLAGGKEYFDAIGSEFSSILSSASVGDSFLSLAERIYNSESDHVKNGPLSADYIHIKQARFYNSAGAVLPQSEAVWWRGRISEVSGYSLGIISG